jgi:hypothetical protein
MSTAEAMPKAMPDECPKEIPAPSSPIELKPAEPVVVDEVDRLRAENLNLQLINLVNRETILQQQVADMQNRQLPELHRERQVINDKMTAMRVDLEQKYGINLNTHHIRPDDGLVIPRNPGAAEALQRLRRQVTGA